MEKTRQVISDTEILSVFSPPPSGWNVSCYRVNWDPDDDDNTLQPIDDIATAILDPFEYISSMEYDALNRARSITYPQDVDGQRKILVPTYNKGGALTRVDLKDTALSSPVNYVDRIAYNAKGQQLLVAYGNGIMTRFLYRSDNFRLLRLKSEKYTKSGLTYTPNSGVKQNYSYEYDLSGNIINISDTTAGCGYEATPDAISREFIYDALYRLISATGRETAATGTTPWTDLYRPENESLARGYRQQYDYDKLGNIQELQHIATSGNFTRSFDYGAFTKNTLSKITIGSNEYDFDYDVNGNMLSEGDTARHLEYDCADRLRCFYVKTGSAEPSKYTHYLYDGSGNRVKKITRKQGGSYTATTYIDDTFEYTKESTGFDAIPNLTIGTWTIGSYSSVGEQNILHIMGGATMRIGAALGDSTPAIKYNLSDHLGSSCVQLDIHGTTVSLEEYYPFGETSFGSYAKKRYRFCSKEKDEESGLYYYGMRYYSPWTCRFINVDPLAGKTIFMSPYAYANCNPIMMNDPTGGTAEGGGDGGGKPTATNTSDIPVSDDPNTDGVGVDVVKLNGVDYATWKEDDGTIKIQKLSDHKNGVKNNIYSSKNIANKAMRDNINNYWKNIEAKQLNIHDQQVAAAEQAAAEQAAAKQAAAEQAAAEQAAAKQAATEEAAAKQSEHQDKVINDAFEKVGEIYNPIKTIAGIIIETTESAKESLSKRIEDIKTITKKQFGPPLMEDSLAKIKPLAEYLKKLGVGFTIAGFVQLIIEFKTRPLTPGSYVTLILDSIVEAGTIFMGLAGVAVGFAYDLFKKTDIFKKMAEDLGTWIRDKFTQYSPVSL